MPLVRVSCQMTEDQNYDEDPQSIIVLYVALGPDNRLNTKIQSIGYNRCWTENGRVYKRYPFILDLNGVPPEWGRLDYGGFDEDSDDRINLIGRSISCDTEFTFSERRDGEETQYTYVVKRVDDPEQLLAEREG